MSAEARILLSRDHLEALRRNRAVLAEKIKESREVIRNSEAQMQRLDEILANAGQKP
jgi:hypothetical protein